MDEGLPNLADPSEGAAVIAVSDEFFAPAKRMLDPHEPVFLPERFDDHGKWMDGWESRRRRDGRHDYCVLRIVPGTVRGIELDTRHFTGNYPAAASVEACRVDSDPTPETAWMELLPRTPLGPDRTHRVAVARPIECSHLRLNIYPDGGIARLRVYGNPATPSADRSAWTNLAASEAGAVALYCNDMHFGHMDNLLAPGPSSGMADGWETRRRREPGNDFAIVRLSRPGSIRRAEIDTAHFRGNYPARAGLRGAHLQGGDCDPEASAEWPLLLAPMALGPDQLQVFERQLQRTAPVSHVRLDIFPDGGVARLRLLGSPEGA